jgi:transcriptional regulator with XRE-family HTH domain
MALFFDSSWFDAQLGAKGLTRADAAQALQIGAEQVAEMWKDQRELSVNDVRALASLLGAPVQEIANRAGVSTPIPAEKPADTASALAELNDRLAGVERSLIELKALLLDLRKNG